MGLLKRRTVFMGLSSLLVASSVIFADGVVDATFDDNENEFENYWYYFDDNSGMGLDDRPKAGTGTTPSTINVVSKDVPRNFKGDLSDTYPVKKYTFTPGTAVDGAYAAMPYTMGSNWKTSWGEGKPFVGIGTMLAEDGKSIDLTGATGVYFKIKTKIASTLIIKFKVQTLQIDQYSEVASPPKGAFAYYEYEVTAKNEWTDVTVSLADLKLPAWAKAGSVNDHKLPFDITKVTKLAWEVKKEDNSETTSDELGIKDVKVVGSYTYVSPTIHTETASMTVPCADEKNGLFSAFEAKPENSSPLSTWWYAYNDAQIKGNSSVTNGATLDPDTKRLLINCATPGTGSDGTGKGAYLEFALGKSVLQNDNNVQGFIGIGCNTYDSGAAVYWDAQKDGANSIYFHYMLDGDVKWVTLEISDYNDVGDSKNPNRKDTRGSGVVWYINLLPTGPTFKAVQIPFSKLVYHSGWKGSQNIPLDTKRLAKLQWKVQGSEGKSGKIVVDNICFPGVTNGFHFGGSGAVLNSSRLVKNAVFNASFLNGNIHINMINKTPVTNGTFSLVNTQGAVISTSPITRAIELSVDMPASKLPAGMYFVRMNAVDVNGKAIVSQSPVTIVK